MQRKRRLAFKQPEIKKCLEAVNLLLQRREEGEPVRLPCREACREGKRGGRWKGLLRRWCYARKMGAQQDVAVGHVEAGRGAAVSGQRSGQRW